LTPGQSIFLFVAALLGGALNAFAGGGSFIAFPALLFTGIRPIAANATNTVAMWTGVTASGSAYRRRLNVPMRVMGPLLGASVCGGLIGAILLLRTPPHTFMRLLPWLMLGATLLFTFGKKLVRTPHSKAAVAASRRVLVLATIFEFLVSIYGGYFGAGMGFAILAMLALVGMTDIHAMNGLKSVLSSTTNGLAAIAFVIARSVHWPQAVVMSVGAILGGYVGAHYAQRLPQAWVRTAVIVVACSMTTYFFFKVYG
jgi:hypothetical protein